RFVAGASVEERRETSRVILRHKSDLPPICKTNTDGVRAVRVVRVPLQDDRITGERISPDYLWSPFIATSGNHEVCGGNRSVLCALLALDRFASRFGLTTELRRKHGLDRAIELLQFAGSDRPVCEDSLDGLAQEADGRQIRLATVLEPDAQILQLLLGQAPVGRDGLA